MLNYGAADQNNNLDALVAREALLYMDDACVGYSNNRVGYEIPIGRHFHVSEPSRPLDMIEAGRTELEKEDGGLLNGGVG